MDIDKTNKRMTFAPEEWRLLGRTIVRNTRDYSLPLTDVQVASVANDAVGVRRRLLDIDESEFPAGAQRSQLIDEKHQKIALAEGILTQLKPFLPHEVELTLGDEAEEFLRSLQG